MVIPLVTGNPEPTSLSSMLCLIVGLSWLAGFAVDVFVLAVSPQLRSMAW